MVYILHRFLILFLAVYSDKKYDKFEE